MKQRNIFILSLCLFIFSTFSCFAQELKGLNALITGGSRGIGEACAYAFAREGANVAIAVAKSIEEAEEVAEKIRTNFGVDAMVCTCDVSNPEQVKSAVQSMVSKWGSIDILVNNAGIVHSSGAEDLSYEDWKRMIDVNLSGVFLCAKEAGCQMITQGNGGSIINISSICAHIVVVPQKQCHYNAAKAGVGMLTKSLAVEWAEHGIRVNAISPGYIHTKLLDFAKPLHAGWMERTPMKTLGSPEDIAEAVVYLASHKAKFITGSDWVIDGGYVCP